MSLPLATRGLYGPAGGASVSQATGGLYVSRWSAAAPPVVLALSEALILSASGGAVRLEAAGGECRLVTRHPGRVELDGVIE